MGGSLAEALEHMTYIEGAIDAKVDMQPNRCDACAASPLRQNAERFGWFMTNFVPGGCTQNIYNSSGPDPFYWQYQDWETWICKPTHTGTLPASVQSVQGKRDLEAGESAQVDHINITEVDEPRLGEIDDTEKIEESDLLEQKDDNEEIEGSMQARDDE
jgi:hypothetical protein